MCFSLESSLCAWALSIAFVVLLWTRNKLYDRWNASFLLCFSTIQLVEAGLWYNLGSQGSNKALTSTILPLLLLQPLVQNYMGWKTTGSEVLKSTTILYLLLFLSAFSQGMGKEYHTVVGEKGHLVWETKEGEGVMPGWAAPLYLFGLFFPLLWQNKKGIPLIATGALTALYSWFKTNGREFSSYWCFTSVIYGVIAYAL
ncbi:membrane protein [Golden Marseillevirus]|uniref:membrane protein n=1 Tax=Golden Marseillevirus TaxID=1720526 RepID=UPI000877ABCA|nr:membrane protein [Golden Marseillevirus]ALX27592.1 membrane protein [Golden Marseillevirus]